MKQILRLLLGLITVLTLVIPINEVHAVPIVPHPSFHYESYSITVQVGASSDDAQERESTGVVTLTGTDMGWISDVNDFSRYWGGHRFVLPSAIAQNSTVSEAYIQGYYPNTGNNDVNVDLYFQDGTGSPATFTTNANDIQGRTRTTASVSWAVDDVAGGAQWVNSPSLVTVLQEIVDSAEISAVVLIAKPKIDATKRIDFRTWDNAGNTWGLRLIYTLQQPAGVTTLAASQVNRYSALLSGNLTGLGADVSANVSLEWDTNSGVPYANETSVQVRTETSTYSSSLSGLASNTTYYYRAKFVGATEGTVYGSELNFTTSDDYLHWTKERLDVLKSGNYTAVETWANAHIGDTWADWSAPLTANATSVNTSVVVADNTLFTGTTWIAVQQEAFGAGVDEDYHTTGMGALSITSLDGDGVTIHLSGALGKNYYTNGHARITTDWGATGYGTWQESDDMKRWFNTMALMYALTGNTTYADAIVDTLVAMTNWDSWNNFMHRQFQSPARLYQGMATAYDAVADYGGFSSANRTAFVTKSLFEVGHQLYNDYQDSRYENLAANATAGQNYVIVIDGSEFDSGDLLNVAEASWAVREWVTVDYVDGNTVYFTTNLINNYHTADTAILTTEDQGTMSSTGDGEQWKYGVYATPNQQLITGAALGLMALALGGQAPPQWLTAAEDYQTIAMGLVTVTESETDGGWFEGSAYLKYALDGGIDFWDALKISGGTDYFTVYNTFLTGTPKWMAFITYNGYKVIMGDATWSVAIDNWQNELMWMYRLADELNDGKAQQWGDTYIDTAYPQAYYWKDATIATSALSGYGNYAYFEPGYFFWKEEWTDTGLMVIFHAASSLTHSNASYGEFQIYDEGKPVISQYGYIGDTNYEDLPLASIITEGADWTYAGITVPGYGQGIEEESTGYNAGDASALVEESVQTSNYSYMRVNNSAMYGGTSNHTSNVGNLSTAVRHLFWDNTLNMILVGDRLASSSNTTFNWLVYAHNNAGVGEVISYTFSGDNVTLTKAGGTTPSSNTSTDLFIIDPDTGYTSTNSTLTGTNSKYLKVVNSSNSTSQTYAVAIYPQSADKIEPVRVKVGNALGVIVSVNATQRDLLLFSDNGSAVSQSIPLGDSYSVVAEGGGTGTPNGNNLDVSFTNYYYGKLEQSWPHKLNNVGSIAKIMGIVIASIAKVMGIE